MGDMTVGGVAPGVGDTPPDPNPAQDIVNQLADLWGNNRSPTPNDANWMTAYGMIQGMGPLWTNSPASSAAKLYNTLLTDFKANANPATIATDISNLNQSLPVLTSTDVLNCLTVNSSDPPRTCALQVLANNLFLSMTQQGDFGKIASIVQGITSVIDHFANNTLVPIDPNTVTDITDITDNVLNEYLNTIGTTGYPQALCDAFAVFNIELTAPAEQPDTPGEAILSELQAAMSSWSPNGDPGFDTGNAYQGRVGGLVEGMKNFWDLAGGQFKKDMDTLYSAYNNYVTGEGSDFPAVQSAIYQITQDGDPTQQLINNGGSTDLNMAMQNTLNDLQKVLFTPNYAVKNLGLAPENFAAFLKGMTSVVELFTQTGAYSGSCYFGVPQRIAIQQVVDRDIPTFINEGGYLDLTQLGIADPADPSRGGIPGYYYPIQSDIENAVAILQTQSKAP